MTRALKSSRSTASAPPAGTRASSAQARTRLPARRSSSWRSPTALCGSSERSELEQTSSANPSRRCTGDRRPGFISTRSTSTPARASVQAASLPARPAPTTVTRSGMCLPSPSRGGTYHGAARPAPDAPHGILFPGPGGRTLMGIGPTARKGRRSPCAGKLSRPRGTAGTPQAGARGPHPARQRGHRPDPRRAGDRVRRRGPERGGAGAHRPRRRGRDGEVARIDAALARIADGTYGRCAGCGELIEPRRLEANPYAVQCTDCAEAVLGARPPVAALLVGAGHHRAVALRELVDQPGVLAERALLGARLVPGDEVALGIGRAAVEGLAPLATGARRGRSRTWDRARRAGPTSCPCTPGSGCRRRSARSGRASSPWAPRTRGTSRRWGPPPPSSGRWPPPRDGSSWCSGTRGSRGRPGTRRSGPT